MKASLRTISIWGIMAIALSQIGCGKGFDVQVDGDSSQASVATGFSASNFAKSAAFVKSSDGSLQWQTSQDSDQSTVQFEMKVPFGRFYKSGATLVKNLLPYSCQFISGLSNSAPSSYASGEIPCGAIVDGNWKQLMALTVDSQSGSSDGFNYSVSGATLPVWLGRAQRTGNYSEADLDSKQNRTRTSSARFGDDISLRYVPAGQTGRLEICMNMPGTTIRSSTQTIHGSASKKILGIKIGFASDFDVNPGQAVYDYARGCFAMDMGWQGDQLAPSLQLTATQAPYLSNATYSGLNIKIKDWFLRLVDNIMGFFKASLRVKAQNQATRLANDVLDQDVETGRWFSKIHGEKTLQSVGQKVTLEISKSMARVGVPLSAGDLRVMVLDACHLEKYGSPQDWTKRLEAFCTDVVNKIQISIEPFAVDADSQAKGCYSYLGRLNESSGKWWATDCQYVARFKVSLPNDYKDYLTELKQILAAKFSLQRIPDSWKPYLTQWQVDELTLAQLLEQADKIGYTQINSSDWTSSLGTLIQQIKLNRAQN